MINVGLIGTGGIANAVHIPAFQKMSQAKVVAVCDIKKEKALAAAKILSIPENMVFEDYNDLLNVVGLDAVDICTPNYLHSEIAVNALNKGLHVFTEKPDAVSVKEVLKMQQVAKQSGKVLMAMRNNRFLNSSVYLKRFIEEGNMGEVYTARCGWIRRRGIPGKGGWFTTKAKSGGGPLIDLGVHMIDLAIWLMGNPKPVTVSGCTYTKFADFSFHADSEHAKFGEATENGTFDVEDLATGFIRFDNGASLQLEFSWASNIESENKFVELRGTKAGSIYQSTDNKLKIFGEKYGSTFKFLPNINESVSPHEANLRHFIDVIEKDAEPIFVPQQGVDMIKIIEALYKSAQTNQEVKL